MSAGEPQRAARPVPDLPEQVAVVRELLPNDGIISVSQCPRLVLLWEALLEHRQHRRHRGGGARRRTEQPGDGAVVGGDDGGTELQRAAARSCGSPARAGLR